MTLQINISVEKDKTTILYRKYYISNEYDNVNPHYFVIKFNKYLI